MNPSQPLTIEIEIDKAVTALWNYHGFIQAFLPRPIATLAECKEFVVKNIGTGNNLQKLGAAIQNNTSNGALANLCADLKR